ncbi:MAG: SURF1 family protein [Hyphomicrobiaceae bacterium]
MKTSADGAPAEAAHRSIFWPTVAMLPALALLVGLGTWQMQRKAWKEGLIAKIESRVVSKPIPLADALARHAKGEDIEFLPVVAKGRFARERSLFYYAPGSKGPGFHVFTPLRLDGTPPAIDVLIVNRGFVPERERSAAAVPAPAGATQREVIGLVRFPPRPGAFTPANDVAHNLWFWPDVAAMTRAAFGDTPRTSPKFYLAEAAELSTPRPAAPGVPQPPPARIELPNRHLEYALTWYAFAASLLAVYGFFVRSRRKAIGPPPGRAS